MLNSQVDASLFGFWLPGNSSRFEFGLDIVSKELSFAFGCQKGVVGGSGNSVVLVKTAFAKRDLQCA